MMTAKSITWFFKQQTKSQIHEIASECIRTGKIYNTLTQKNTVLTTGSTQDDIRFFLLFCVLVMLKIGCYSESRIKYVLGVANYADLSTLVKFLGIGGDLPCDMYVDILFNDILFHPIRLVPKNIKKDRISELTSQIQYQTNPKEKGLLTTELEILKKPSPLLLYDTPYSDFTQLMHGSISNLAAGSHLFSTRVFFLWKWYNHRSRFDTGTISTKTYVHLLHLLTVQTIHTFRL